MELTIAVLGIVVVIASFIGFVFACHGDSEWPIAVCAMGFFGGLLMVSAAIVMDDSNAKMAFMRDCLAERKSYECTAMWRAGDVNTVPVVVPMVVR